MRAAVVTKYGGPEVIEVQDVADPVPAADEILVRVVSSAINRADTMQREGGYPDPRGRSGPEILGLEFAGTVAETGARVTSWKVGDAVMGIEVGACNAELVTTHERQALPVPSNVALGDAAAIPEVYLTAWDALVVQGGLTNGRWALVHAGASGVGTAGILLAKAIGARIAVTCSAGKADACRELGADLVLERSPADWVPALKDAVPDGVDTVLDVIGGDEANRNLAAVRPQGTIVQVGLMGGGQTPVNLGLLLVKRVHWIGTALRTRPLEQKVALSQRFRREVIPLFESGALKPVIDSRFALADIVEAHRRMDSNANVGKIVVDVSQGSRSHRRQLAYHGELRGSRDGEPLRATANREAVTMTLTELTPNHKELLEAIAYESVATTGSSYARCADGHGTLTHLFFSEDEFDIARSKAICSRCGLAEACLSGALERAEVYGVWGGQLVVDGAIVAVKRGRGRPPKHPRPPIVVDEVPVPPHLVA